MALRRRKPSRTSRSRCPPQAADLGLERVDLSQFRTGRTGTLSAVDLGLDHPPAYGLLADTELPGHDRSRGRQRGVLALVVIDQSYRSGFNSSSIFFGMVPILLDSNRSGIKPWGDS